MLKTTSDDSATPRGVSAHFMPLSISHCALDLVRLVPVTVCPLAIRRSVIRPPMTPRPTYPRFAIMRSRAHSCDGIDARQHVVGAAFPPPRNATADQRRLVDGLCSWTKQLTSIPWDQRLTQDAADTGNARPIDAC